MSGTSEGCRINKSPIQFKIFLPWLCSGSPLTMEIWPSTKYTEFLLFLHSPSADSCICIFLLLLLVQLLTILPTQKSNEICLTSCIVKYQNIISYSCDFIDFYHNSPLLFLFQSECPGLFIFACWGRHSVGDCLYDNFPYHFSSWQGQKCILLSRY